MWNPLLPSRPRQTEDGHLLNYRTHLSRPSHRYVVTLPPNRACQVSLYHWCRNIDYANGVPVDDLFRFLLVHHHPTVTKFHLGRTVRQTVIYDPTKLKGKSKNNPHAAVTYVWHDREELQYGLEWMLSTWLWTIEHEFKDMMPNPQEKMLEIFDDLAGASESELESLWVKPALGSEFMGTIKEPNWKDLNLPIEQIQHQRMDRSTKLRSLWGL